MVFILQKNYGVEKLTNLELFQIRRDATKVIKETAGMFSHFTEENAEEMLPAISYTIPKSAFGEILFRFLSFYGIDFLQIPKVGDDVRHIYVEKKLREAREEYHKPYLD